MFIPRQLLGHGTLVAQLQALAPEVLKELGPERGKAIITYLQFAIDIGLDYNCRLTTWESTRKVVKHIFARHGFAVSWTFGEMVFAGPNSGTAWTVYQVWDAYRKISSLVTPLHQQHAADLCHRLQISQGTAAHMASLQDKAVDLICMDPPYYNNVTYSELSDFFYVWQRRTLHDLYPDLFQRRATDKENGN